MAGGGIAVLIGVILRWIASRADQKNWIIEKAPPLPIRLANVHDDVWVSGDVRCDDPLRIPHFSHGCVYYEYKKEEKVTRRVGKRTTTSWVTRDHQTNAIPFRIDDEGSTLWIIPENARLEDLSDTGYDYDGGWLGSNWRHSATFLPCPGRVSAVGSVSEKRDALQPYQNIPLIVTTRSRKEYLKSIERGETVLRVIGYILLFLGFLALFAGLTHLDGWMGSGDEGMTMRFATAIGGAILLFFLCWLWITYNRIVMYRIRADAAWRQIDVDLKQRYDMIPNLVATVKAYAQHESSLFEEIARLRNLAAQSDRRQTMEIEPQVVGKIRSLNAVIEQSPDLKANELFLRLHQQLTAIEDKIAYGREFFNDAVAEYNIFVQQFPASLVFRRPALPMFVAIENEKHVPDVKL